MRYADLHDLIFHSSSSRRYFLSLPVEMQMSLHQYNDCIHTATGLHECARILERYHHALAISGFEKDGRY